MSDAADSFVFARYRDLPERVRRLSVALGNFDGLHRGHEAVLNAARAAAQHGGTGWALATFEPPPRVYFQRGGAAFRITLPEERAELARAAGAGAVFELPFDEDLARMTDEDFVTRVLHEGLGAAHVSVGEDFRFGRGRMGDSASLQRHALGLGIGVSVVSPVMGGANKVSSSAIRAAIEAGHPEEAAGLLGRWWSVTARVVDGQKRGRTIGFPTANMYLGDRVQPKHGIYTVLCRIEGEAVWRPGVANFGRTPTTGLRDALLEVFLIDWSGDLYGKRIETAFISFQREEAHFDTLAALVTQMGLDSEKAQKSLARYGNSLPKPALPALDML